MSVFCLGGKDGKVASSRPVGAVPNREKKGRKHGEKEGRKKGK